MTKLEEAEMEAISWDDIIKAIVVIVAVLGGIAAVWKGIEAWKNLSGANKRAQEMGEIRMSIEGVSRRVDKIETTLDEHDRRLEEGDKQMKVLREDTKQILNTQNALLMHFISTSADDSGALEKVKANLDAYLASR